MALSLDADNSIYRAAMTVCSLRSEVCSGLPRCARN